jgi:hypothetical protein
VRPVSGTSGSIIFGQFLFPRVGVDIDPFSRYNAFAFALIIETDRAKCCI